MSATEPIRSKKTIQAMESYYFFRGEIRNHTLVVLGIHTALRIGDLLSLRWGDVFDFERRRVRGTVTLIERKTGKLKIIALHRKAISALDTYSKHYRPTDPEGALFANVATGRPISRIQAYRIVRGASEALEIERVSCHSLRKTFGYHAWKSGVPPTVIMEIYNHSSYSVTRRYLGVTRDDTDAVYLDMQLG
ncbi:MAG: tyrosine-type recombinase/integrase [Oscillospiraceae bacterium]|jgi:integrase|nr:tyrosine-type recombinase/integrase [Oscillospiraceae bacterium]